MGTNYYAAKRPTKEEREKLKELIDLSESDVSKYPEIIELVDKLYHTCDTYEHDRNIIHLGKSSYGWKFLWNPNIYKVYNGYRQEDGTWKDEYTYEKKYELTKEGIRNFVMQDDIIVFNEYDEVQDKEEFLDFAFNKDGVDSSTCRDDDVGCRYDMSESQKMWKELGYKFEDNCSFDFYNDGLRFSTSTAFS